MTPSNKSLWLALAATALVGLGCPGAPVADPIEPAPVINGFTASRTTVSPGDTVTLSWETANATSVSLTAPSGTAVPEVSDPNGSVDVVVTRDELFVLTATNQRGATERLAVSVKVSSSAHDLMLYVLPAELVAGESAALTWSAPGAQTVTITASPGGALDLAGQKALGTLSVSPTASTTYTLVADDKTAVAKVVVRPRIEKFISTPVAAPRGGTLTLSWQTAGATEVTISSPGRGVIYTSPDATAAASGTHAETISATVDASTLFNYTLTAKDASGALSTQNLLVPLQGAATITSFTGPGFARTGEDVSLNWTTLETTKVTITANGALIYESPDLARAASGTVTFPAPAQVTSYVLKATNERGGSATRTISISPVAVPSITSFSATPATVVAGAPVTLSWQAENALRIRITDANEGVVYGFDGSKSSDTVTVYPNQTAVYTLTVDNLFGDADTETRTVTVTSPAVLTSPTTGTVISGAATTIDWNPALGAQIHGLAHSQVTTRSTSGFEDISTTGEALVFPREKDDDQVKLPTAFPVTLFGQRVGGEIFVSTNGYMVLNGHANGDNFEALPLPTGRIEPFAVAPYWADMSLDTPGAAIYWERKTTSTGAVLIVQWDNMIELVTDDNGISFQAKIHESGQIDFEYKDLPTATHARSTGVQGPAINWAVSAAAPANGGLTFFGPISRPAPVTLVTPSTFTGAFPAGTGGWRRVSTRFDSVVAGRDLMVSEVMAHPHASVASDGEWVEVSNKSASTVDLTGWTLRKGDGGTYALSGTIAPAGSIVFGESLDPQLNGDAGVHVVLSGLELGDTNDSLSLVRGTALAPVSWTTSFGPGAARVFDPGPYVAAGGTSQPDGTSCAANIPFSLVQQGTPGKQTTCGFGYIVQSIPGSYFEIAKTGTRHFGVPTTTQMKTLIFPSGDPRPVYNGTAWASVNIGSKGLLSFNNSSTSTATNKTEPSTSYPTGTLAVYWDDLRSGTVSSDPSDVYWKRVAANEDPRNPSPHWIIEWRGYSATSTTAKTDDLNFQAKFFDNGVIEYHYGEMRGSYYANASNGRSATIWLENQAGNLALPIGINQAVITPHSGYRFIPR